MTSNILKAFAAHLVAFRNDEDGAVTVDWVVLTSSVMLMGAAHAHDVATGVTNIGDAVEVCLVNDVANIVDGDPATYVQNLQAAAAACSGLLLRRRCLTTAPARSTRPLCRGSSTSAPAPSAGLPMR